MNTYSGASGAANERGEPKKDRKTDPQDPFGDLVVEDEDKNWKGICIAFLVISTIVSFIVIAIMILTPSEYFYSYEGPRIMHPRITLEDIISDHYQPEDFSGSWISESELVTKNKTDGSIVIIDASSNSSRVIVSNTTIRQYNVKKFLVSTDNKFVLLTHDVKRAHRYSQTAKYKIFNISNEHSFPLETSEGQEIQYAAFGPSGSQLVFVQGNNIYYLPSVGESVRQLTRTGQDGSLWNGVPDWIYGEKILRTDHAVWFSPDGTRLAYVSFDDSKVASIVYPKYGSYDDPNNVFPEVTSLRYPKAGRVNPEVSLWVVDLPSGNTRKLTPPSEIFDRDHYFTAFSWIDEDRLAAVWMRREQNYSVVSLCSEDKNWACERHLIERLEGDSSGWVELFDSPLITTDKTHYLLRLPLNDGDSGAFRQIAMITINGRVRNFLTQGMHDVTRVLAHRSDIRTVFYEATSPDRPGERHVYSIPDIHSMLPRNPSCLTCNHLVANRSGNCSFHSASFSPNAMYYTLTCLGLMAPWTEVRTVEDNQIVLRLEPDKNVQHIVDARAFPSIKTLRLPLHNKFHAEVCLFLPPVLRETEFLRFPLVMEIASSPGDEGVSAKLTVDWGLYLSSKRDFIYARVDVRGSRNHGDRNLHQTWHRLGTVEVEDILEVMSILTTDLPFVDPKRTAIWGWSYGGYIAASVIAHERNSFNCGIAVAPITNWLFLDSFTSERYFGHPWHSGNYIRYEKSDLIHKAIQFRDKNLFIIHGTGDYSVHLQNSFSFMKSLNDAGVVYRSQVYPDSNHYLDDVKYHFYRSMETYLFECFKLREGQDITEGQNTRSAL